MMSGNLATASNKIDPKNFYKCKRPKIGVKVCQTFPNPQTS